jgi:hypothetical protein
MRKSAANWKRTDLDQLYLGFGFKIRYGSKHDVVSHPDYPELRATLPRHTSVAKGYIKIAIELIEKLEQRMAEEKPDHE